MALQGNLVSCLFCLLGYFWLVDRVVSAYSRRGEKTRTSQHPGQLRLNINPGQPLISIGIDITSQLVAVVSFLGAASASE